MHEFKIVVIGASAGGMEALDKIVSAFDKDFFIPVVIVQHLAPSSENYLVNYLDEHSHLKVVEATEKQNILPGHIYLAPPNYHLLIEDDQTLSLAVSEKVNFSRPSIDVLFETAIMAFRSKVIGVLLTGASRDGAEGMRLIHEAGGMTIVQDPKDAFVPVMPQAAINHTTVDYILPLEEIAPFLNTISSAKQR